MNTRQALTHSLAVTQSVREKAITTLRGQLETQLGIAKKALDDGDFEIAGEQFANAAATCKALHENLELDEMSRCTVAEAPDERLAEELIKRAESGEKDARAVLIKAYKRITQPKKAGGKARA